MTNLKTLKFHLNKNRYEFSLKLLFISILTNHIFNIEKSFFQLKLSACENFLIRYINYHLSQHQWWLTQTHWKWLIKFSLDSNEFSINSPIKRHYRVWLNTNYVHKRIRWINGWTDWWTNWREGIVFTWFNNSIISWIKLFHFYVFLYSCCCYFYYFCFMNSVVY